MDIYKKDTVYVQNHILTAAGDCLFKPVKQIVTAAADGAEAAVRVCRALNEED